MEEYRHNSKIDPTDPDRCSECGIILAEAPGHDHNAPRDPDLYWGNSWSISNQV